LSCKIHCFAILAFRDTKHVAKYKERSKEDDKNKDDHLFHYCKSRMYFRVMKRSLLVLLSFLSINIALAQDRDVVEIRKLLLAQVMEWNNGSIDGYMKGYWESDSLLFIGSSGPRYGYEATLKRYKDHYPDAAHMGHLKTSISSMQRLSDDYYFIVGKWALNRSAGNVDGSFTLLFRKIKGKWVIVCDHSS